MFLTGRFGQLEDLRLGVPELAAQLLGALAGGLELVGDVTAERFGEALLECAQLLAQPVVVRLRVGQVGVHRGDGDSTVGDRGVGSAPAVLAGALLDLGA